MCNVLQDVDDIMSNQLSDVFQLLDWVVNIINIFGFKICNDQEWKMFNNRYNWDMGVVTTYNPTHKTICTANDSPMNEADRDELSKAHVELDSARTTIKNLSEAVVNFSHSGHTLTHIHEE